MRIVSQALTDYTSINVNQEATSWSSVTTYALGDGVERSGKTYVSCIASNLNNDPLTDDGKWFNCGVDNKFAAVDLDSNDKVICDSTTITSGTVYSLDITIPTTDYDRVVIIGAEGSALTITEKDALDATVNTINVAIDETQASPSVNHAFVPHVSATKAQIVVTEKTTGGYSAIQYLVAGEETLFGSTKMSASFSIGGLAEVYTGQNGITTITRFGEGDTLEFDIVFSSADFMTMKRNAKHFKHIQAAYVADEEDTSVYENLCTCGYLESFDVVLTNPNKTFASIEIKEI